MIKIYPVEVKKPIDEEVIPRILQNSIISTDEIMGAFKGMKMEKAPKVTVYHLSYWREIKIYR